MNEGQRLTSCKEDWSMMVNYYSHLLNLLLKRLVRTTNTGHLHGKLILRYPGLAFEKDQKMTKGKF